MRPEQAQQLRRIAGRLQGRERGLFIAFEGGDGSGKSTQVRLIGTKLQELGAPVEVTFEPGATPLGQQLRDLVQHGPDDVDPRTEALLYATDRAYHVATVVRPALARGESVLTDRYLDSSVAYQGIGRGLGAQEVRDLSLWATGNLEPDAVVLLEVDPEIGLGRIGRERDRLENAGEEFHRRVTKYYKEMAEAHPDRYWTVDANGSVEDTTAGILNALVQIVN